MRADLFEWRPDATYDVVFFGFWLSHVPPERFGAFWDIVRSALKPGGRVFFMDSLCTETREEKKHLGRDPRGHMTLRKLNDGREFRIVKIFYEPEELSSWLRELGWNIRTQTTGNHILYGHGTLA